MIIIRILLGIIFIASFVYSKREENPEYKLVKRMIGDGALLASIFDAIYIMALLIKDPSDGSYFIKELYDFWPKTLQMCSLFSIVAILFLIVTVLRKTKILYFFCAVVFSVFSYILVRLLLTLDDSLSPMWESHIRSVEFWFLPLIFFCIFIWDLLKKKADIVKMRNCIIIVLLCGVFQTVWQCIHCYFWDVNVQYMKNELKNTDAPLYIPSEHYEISSFFNPWFRRYIWWGNYAEMSILFSDTYKIKTLLVNYDFEMDEGNKTFRKYLYTIPESKQISIPYGGLNIAYQNKFWDITKPAEALHKYNEEHNIITDDKE